MNKKTWYYAAGAVIVIILIVLAVRAKHEAPKSEGQTQNDIAPVSDQMQQASQTPEMQSNTWEGTLQTSNNPAKGNLMLVTDKTTIYINTSRDFSELTGKKVQVSYEGTLDSFTLGDITAE